MLDRRAPTSANPHLSSTGTADPLPSTRASRRGTHQAAGGVGESGSKPSSAGVSRMRSTRKYLSLSSRCSRTMVRNSDRSQYRTPVIGFRLQATILYSQ